MTSAYIAVITCDGPRFGRRCPSKSHGAIAIIQARAELREQGWVNRAHGDERVDLCPSCWPSITLDPPSYPQPGRPPRRRA